MMKPFINNFCPECVCLNLKVLLKEIFSKQTDLTSCEFYQRHHLIFYMIGLY